MGEGSLAQVGSVDCVERALCRPLCVGVGHLIALHPEVDPSDSGRVSPAHELVEGPMASMAMRCPGLNLSEDTRSMAEVESAKIVSRRPRFSLLPKI